jgi:hypothetical protein
MPSNVSIGKICKHFDVCQETIRNWERNGHIPEAIRTPGGHRRYGQEHVDAVNKLLPGKPMDLSKPSSSKPAPSHPEIPDASLGLLVKLGSIAVHTEEMLSPGVHAFDKVALEALLNDETVRLWLKRMDDAGLLPVKR